MGAGTAKWQSVEKIGFRIPVDLGAIKVYPGCPMVVQWEWAEITLGMEFRKLVHLATRGHQPHR